MAGSGTLRPPGVLETADIATRLLDTIPVPIGYIDTRMIVRACTRSAAQVLGRSVSDIVEHPVSEFFSAGSDMLISIEDVVATGTARFFASRTKSESAVQHWDVSLVPDFVDSTLVGVVAVGIDVTDLVDAQRQVAESERLYRAIGELLPFGTWIAEGDGGLTYLSDSFVEMTGRDRDSLLGWGWLELLPSDHARGEARAEWHHVLGRPFLRDTKHAIRAKDGSTRYVLCRGARIADGPDGAQKWAGIHIDITEAERQLRFHDALSEVKDLLVSTLETDQLLEHVAGAVLAPTSADFAAIVELHHGQWWEVRHAAGSYVDSVRARRLRRSEMPLNILAYESGEIQIVSDACNDDRMNADRARADGLKSMINVPVKRHGATLCLLVLAYTTTHVNADRIFREFLADLSVSLDLALQGAEEHEHQRQIAETLQESLLAVPEHLPNVEIAHLYEAAVEEERVGGDFYDAFALGDEIAFLIGDVAGSGLAAAALTALAKNTIRAHLMDGQTPAGALTKTNLVMHAFTDASEFATVFVGLLDPRTGDITYSSAGHPAPLVVSRDGVRELPGDGILLGAFDDSRYSDSVAQVRPDETVVLYTDGIIEARSGADLYGEERLEALLASQRDVDPSELIRVIFEDTRVFAEGRLDDDVALLAITPDVSGS